MRYHKASNHCSGNYIDTLDSIINNKIKMDKNLYYKDFCIAFCNYAIKRIQSDTSLSDADISFCIEPLKRQIQEISKQYDNGEKRLIDKIYRMDIIEAFDYPDFLIENQKYFMDTYGVNILDLDKKKQNKIAKILERGKIKTDNEFRMILEHVDGLCQTDGNSDMIEKLNVLLRDYEELAEAKLQKRKK